VSNPAGSEDNLPPSKKVRTRRPAGSAQRIQDLERSLAVLRGALDATNDGILISDDAGNILEVNDRYLSLWGLSKDSIQAGPSRQTFERNARRLDNHSAYLARIAEIDQSEQTHVDELRLKDGRVFERTSTFHRVTEGRAVRIWSVREVTDRVRAEELQARLAAIVESADDAIVGKTLQGIVTSWNQGAERMFGYSEQEMVGQSILRLIPPERHFEEAEILGRVLRGERIEHFETERMRKDGSKIIVSLTISPVKDNGGVVIGASKIARDVTDRERAIAEHGRLAAIVESSEDAIVGKTLEGVITNWNAGAAQVFGYSASEAIGKRVTMLFPPELIPEEDVILSKIRRGERIRHYETERIRKDGKRIRVSLSISPIKDDRGQIIGASKIARDVTEQRLHEEALKLSEARLRAVVEATPECVKIVRPDGSLEFMNHAGMCMVEWGGDRTTNGASVFDLIAPEHRETWIQNHRRVCAGERLNWEFEIVGLKGTRRWMETHAVPLPLPNGETAQLAVTREISARKQHEAEREALLEGERAARSEAEQASRLKDEFLATLSHELRTPLNAILGWSQVLAISPGPSDLQQGLEAIQRNARAQTQLIEDLLDMSRIISGKVRLDVQWTDLAGVIDAAVDAVRPAAEAKQIRIQKILDPLAGPVSGDPTRLQQVFWNLLTNAIKFTPKGGKIDVLLERVNSHLEVTFHDSGIGIKPDFLPYVFERFRQLDSSTSRTYGGLGLGLSIVKHLVELHGGSIRAKSAGEGQGATFVVHLPLAPVRLEEKREHPTALKSPTLNFQNINLSGVKILVVDDEPDARTLIQRLLAECEAEVRVAANADEGLRVLGEFHPDVLVSDIGMPGKDGYQFIREVRALSPEQGGDVTAIALTAFARSEDRTRAMLAGYQIHIAKPIEPQELLATVSSLAGRTGRPSSQGK
jgi:PAS domain S-box-containing protein